MFLDIFYQYLTINELAVFDYNKLIAWKVWLSKDKNSQKRSVEGKLINTWK